MKCKVDGCDNHANRVGAVMCEKHYARVRRHGSTDKQSNLINGDLIHTGGYILKHAPDHPLYKNYSRLFAHRIVYYDNYGNGPFKCFHCSVCVTWATMHIDHLDDNKLNNNIQNLVASCPVCNQKRGYEKMKKSSQERTKWMIEHDGKRMHVSDWAKQIGISRVALKNRLKNWSVQDALTKPVK
jgi:5-methylcytosine-specific restriction endonuclease McrA